MTTLATVAAGTGAITDINDNFIAASPAAMYGRRASATSGLTWGYYGGIAFGATIANGTVSLTASSTNYIVASRSTGAVSVATSTTNWNNTTDYFRLYQVVTGSASVSSYTDHRDFTGGGSGGGGGASDFTDLGDVPASYTGEGGAYVRVKAAEDGLEFVPGGSGGDAVDITYDPSTSGLTATNVQAAIDELAGGGSGGLTNWTESVNTTTPNGTVPVVSLTATNAATNVDAALVPKGTGALVAAVADNASTGGNKRGNYAVDLQIVRSAATQVSSGGYSGILSGQNNTNSRNYSVIAGGDGNTISGSGTRNFIGGGGSNTVSGTYAGVLVGLSCTASGNYATAGGRSAIASGDYTNAWGYEVTADAMYARAGGYGAITRGLIGADAWASGYRSAAGDVQKRAVVLRRTTTNDTPVGMSSNGSAAGASNQLNIPTGGAFKVRGQVSVKRSNGQMAGWDISCLIKNVGGTVSMVGTPVVTLIGSDSDTSTYDVALNADNTNKCLQVQVTGASGHTAYWGCELIAIEVI